VKFYESGICRVLSCGDQQGRDDRLGIGDFENQLVQRAKINGFDVVRS
jgi:hypothetical protein